MQASSLAHHAGAGDGGSTNAREDGGAGVGDGAAVVDDGFIGDRAAMEVDGGAAGTGAPTGSGERERERDQERERGRGPAMGARESLSMGIEDTS